MSRAGKEQAQGGQKCKDILHSGSDKGAKVFRTLNIDN